VRASRNNSIVMVGPRWGSCVSSSAFAHVRKQNVRLSSELRERLDARNIDLALLRPMGLKWTRAGTEKRAIALTGLRGTTLGCHSFFAARYASLIVPNFGTVCRLMKPTVSCNLQSTR
jgi:hypothetical protein